MVLENGLLRDATCGYSFSFRIYWTNFLNNERANLIFKSGRMLWKFLAYYRSLKAWILAHAEIVIEILFSIYLTFLWHFQHGSKFKHLDYLISFYTKKSFSSLKWYLFHIRLSLNNESIWLKHSKLAKTLIRDPFKFCSVCFVDHLVFSLYRETYTWESMGEMGPKIFLHFIENSFHGR